MGWIEGKVYIYFLGNFLSSIFAQPDVTFEENDSTQLLPHSLNGQLTSTLESDNPHSDSSPKMCEITEQ
jgi:hypothetical protein